MIRLAISVEGQTEEEFVKAVLADHLLCAVDVEPTPIPLGPGGGNVSVERLASDMGKLYWSFDAVTSLVDFYGFCAKGEMTVEELEKCLNERIQKKIRHGWDQRKVIPYVQRHEFESLLFSDVAAFGASMGVTEQNIKELNKVRSRFPTPEDINDHQETAPSKWIARIVPKYKKVVDGPILAKKITLKTIRMKCPRFCEWVTRLESLGKSGLNRCAGKR